MQLHIANNGKLTFTLPFSLQFQISIRKADGTIVATSIPPFPAILHSLVQKRNWDEVVRLCRFAQSKQLWACAACMAIASTSSSFLFSFNYFFYLL